MTYQTALLPVTQPRPLDSEGEAQMTFCMDVRFQTAQLRPLFDQQRPTLSPNVFGQNSHLTDRSDFLFVGWV